MAALPDGRGGPRRTLGNATRWSDMTGCWLGTCARHVGMSPSIRRYASIALSKSAGSSDARNRHSAFDGHPQPQLFWGAPHAFESHQALLHIRHAPGLRYTIIIGGIALRIADVVSVSSTTVRNPRPSACCHAPRPRRRGVSLAWAYSVERGPVVESVKERTHTL